MGAIEDAYEDLDAEVSLEEFREAVEEKVDQMGGLADEETAAKLVAHELAESSVEGVADIEPGMESVTFTGKIIAIEEMRTFERDDDEDGKVLNVEVADETGRVRAAFWDEHAEAAAEELEEGDVLRFGGRPKEGYNGVEVSVDDTETVEEDVEVQIKDTYAAEELQLGLSNVNLVGEVLAAESVRTFDRDDGSEGKVASLVLGDETGRVRVTMWDDMAERVDDLEQGDVVEVVDGYIRERDGDLELHLNEDSAVEDVDADVEYAPEGTPIDELEIGQTVDIRGVVRSTDPKRTFDRDDGSEGQVRNVRIQDDTGDIRVALWGDKADADVAPGDEVAFTDVEIQDGWQDDLEASANWRSTVTVVDDKSDGFDSGGGGSTADASTNGESDADGEYVEFTGTVVQASDPVVLDDGDETMSVETSADVTLGQEVTARGTISGDRLDADDVV